MISSEKLEFFKNYHSRKDKWRIGSKFSTHEEIKYRLKAESHATVFPKILSTKFLKF